VASIPQLFLFAIPFRFPGDIIPLIRCHLADMRRLQPMNGIAAGE
jgi:hypothetical protein